MRVREPADVIQLSKVRMRERLRAKLDEAATANRVTLNAEIVNRLEWSLEDERERDRDADQLQQALSYALGEEDAGLALLQAQVLRALGLRGRYLDDRNYEALARGAGRLYQRLAAPDNGRLIRDVDSPEAGVVDDLLEELGRPSHPRAPTYLQRWAHDQRRRFGPRLAAVLLQMYEAAKNEILANGPLDRKKPNPEAVDSWVAALRSVRARPEAEAAEAPASERGKQSITESGEEH